MIGSILSNILLVLGEHDDFFFCFLISPVSLLM